MFENGDLKSKFHSCMPLFIALGDEVRLGIVEALSIASFPNQKGMNVNEITKKTHLSRPAVSHHLKILKDAGMVDSRQEGTANYYYLTIEQSTRQLMDFGRMLQHILLYQAGIPQSQAQPPAADKSNPPQQADEPSNLLQI